MEPELERRPIKSWWLVLQVVLDLVVLQGPPWTTPCQAGKGAAAPRTGGGLEHPDLSLVAQHPLVIRRQDQRRLTDPIVRS